jgi:hypothetical protein
VAFWRWWGRPLEDLAVAVTRSSDYLLERRDNPEHAQQPRGCRDAAPVVRLQTTPPRADLPGRCFLTHFGLRVPAKSMPGASLASFSDSLRRGILRSSRLGSVGGIMLIGGKANPRKLVSGRRRR